MQPQRYIAHFDLDSFFVSVEVVKDPSLKGKPVLVGGQSDRGVVAACSYEARRFGIHSAMPMKQARQLCPHAVVLKGSRGDYSRYSRWVTDIIASKAPLFEKASIDEFYLDLTGMDKYFKPFEWTVALREEIIRQTGLPISFALASSKMVAKIATNEAKPNGFMQVLPGREKEFLAPLTVDKIPGVGEHTHQLLLSMGIRLIGDLNTYDRKALEHSLGKYGLELADRSEGIHLSPVSPYHEARSISTENTFEENKADMAFLLSELVRMTEKVAYELRKDDKLAGCVAVKIRYGDFSTFNKQCAIDYSCRDDELIPVAKELFQKLYTHGRPVRLLGVRLSELNNHVLQGSLFEDTGKKKGLYQAIDDVKNRYGAQMLRKARTIRKDDQKH